MPKTDAAACDARNPPSPPGSDKIRIESPCETPRDAKAALGGEINGSHGDVNVLVMCFSLGIRIETRVWDMGGLPLLSLLEGGILAVQ